MSVAATYMNSFSQKCEECEKLETYYILHSATGIGMDWCTFSKTMLSFALKGYSLQACILHLFIQRTV